MTGIWRLMFFGLPRPRRDRRYRKWMVTDGNNNWTIGQYKTVDGEYPYHQTQARANGEAVEM